MGYLLLKQFMNDEDAPFDPIDSVKVFNALKQGLDRGEEMVLSFKDYNIVPTQFINTAIVQLLNHYDYSFIKYKLKIKDASPNTQKLIMKRFGDEIDSKKTLIYS